VSDECAEPDGEGKADTEQTQWEADVASHIAQRDGGRVCEEEQDQRDLGEGFDRFCLGCDMENAQTTTC